MQQFLILYIFFIVVNTLYEVLKMKKIIYLSVLSIMLLSENKLWLGIMDLSIDNEGEHITNDEIKKIENVNVKFRLGDLINYIEKKLN